MMRDVNIQTPTGLSAAEDAVNHLLQRVRHDADIRWLMIGTESFHRLCVAEAARTGQDTEAVKDRYAKPHPSSRDDRPRIPEMRRRIEELEAKASDSADAWVDRDDGDIARMIMRKALDLCEICAGLPHESINRCRMCRKLAEVI